MRTDRRRSEVIRELSAGLAERDFVLAAWLEGADAQGRVDPFSDIDLWLEVENGREQDGLGAVQEVLESIAPLDIAVEVDHPHALIRQAFFRPGRSSEFLIVDTCVQSHSREFYFRTGVEDEQALVLFDRGEVLEFQELDTEGLQAANLRRLADLERRLLLAETWVRKELTRGRFLDALGAYHRFVMEPLVEALRLRYSPTKGDFHLKHASIDLPRESVSRLAESYCPSGMSELEEHLPLALAWLHEALAEARAAIEPVSPANPRIAGRDRD